MNWKDKAWKYATGLVVVLVILNPEVVQLALFIDAIGLEMFMLLLKVQVVALFGALLITKTKAALALIKRVRTYQCVESSIKSVLLNPENLALAVPGQASVMHLLVCSSAIGIAVNAL